MKPKNLEGKNARDLFPDIFTPPATRQSHAKPKEPSQPENRRKPQQTKLVRQKPSQTKPDTAPPLPPDTSWLSAGLPRVNESNDTPAKRALVIFPDGNSRKRIEETLHRMGYGADFTTTVSQAIFLIHRRPYILVIGHISMVMPKFHEYMQWMAPSQRRMTYYALVGPDLHTLYKLEALSLSTNLVVAEEDIVYFEKILLKGFREYEQLYQPFLEELQIQFPPLG